MIFKHFDSIFKSFLFRCQRLNIYHGKARLKLYSSPPMKRRYLIIARSAKHLNARVSIFQPADLAFRQRGASLSSAILQLLIIGHINNLHHCNEEKLNFYKVYGIWCFIAKEQRNRDLNHPDFTETTRSEGRESAYTPCLLYKIIRLQ